MKAKRKPPLRVLITFTLFIGGSLMGILGVILFARTHPIVTVMMAIAGASLMIIGLAIVKDNPMNP